MRSAPLFLLLLASCQYAGDRSLDFLDQYRAAVGAGTVAGVRSQSWGVVDTGLMIGVKPKAGALGWRYGAPLFFNDDDTRIDVDQAQIIQTTSVVGMDIERGSYQSAWSSFALLPALFTQGDATPTDYEWEVPLEGQDFDDHYWLWSDESFSRNRYAQIHAFDIEFELGLFVYLDTGWSPGEFLDFLLGFLLIDIARDDGRL